MNEQVMALCFVCCDVVSCMSCVLLVNTCTSFRILRVCFALCALCLCACVCLCFCLCFVGEGVTKNLEVAIEFYQQAANGGHLDAQTNLGYIYEHGSEDDNNYVPIDLDAAAAWYGEASEKG